jgi:hypothetical protein
MKNVLVNKRPLSAAEADSKLKEKSPGELIGMMWQLALNAWAFKENLNAEPRLQRHVVVLKRRRG